ncbi:hypothetical protein [Burkholderia vietnamiensis]|uniref:hypothetical protein n=1 Tax=Burkholderia vietnamiensis TaxID=60552 RepID=UPI001CF50C0D|nr:hypothetical protein [Burkholderia vietnamiensis]MCA7945606.1 hypothetical protein [Burkholderia vietnamiensis]
MSTKQERVEHANALIRAIAAHGRRFFYSKTNDRYARLELDGRGRVWFIDDYREARIYTHKAGCWNRMGFSHGGTLKSLVERMRDYVMNGWQLPRGAIAPSYWGYSIETAAATRGAAFELPIMAPVPVESDAPRDYYIISVAHTRRENRYVLLWRPDDKGYTFRCSTAGRYANTNVRAHMGYYNSGCSTIAVPCDVIDALTVMTTAADRLDGTDGPALLNTRANWKKLIANVIARPDYPIEPEFPGARRQKEEA